MSSLPAPVPIERPSSGQSASPSIEPRPSEPTCHRQIIVSHGDRSTTGNRLADETHQIKLDSNNSILILLLKPATMEPSGIAQQKDETLRVEFPETQVHHIKAHISTNWAGKPKPEGIKLIAKGRVLKEDESVGEAVTKQAGDAWPHPIHVVIRPNAFTEKIPITPLPRPLSAPPSTATQSEVAKRAVHSTQINSDPYPHGSLPTSTQVPTHQSLTSDINNLFLPGFPPPTDSSTNGPALPLPDTTFHLLWKHFFRLNRTHKTEFVDNLFKAQFLLTERVQSLRHRLYSHQIELLGSTEVSSLAPQQNEEEEAKEDAGWKPIDDRLTQLLVELNHYGEFQDTDNTQEPLETAQSSATYLSEFKRVEISGLPFLMYIPKQFQERSLKAFDSKTDARFKKLKRTQQALGKALHLDSRLNTLLIHTHKMQKLMAEYESLLANPFGLGFPPLAGPLGPTIPGVNNPPPAPNGPMGVGAPFNMGAGLGLGFAAGAGGAGFGNGLFQFPNNLMMPNGAGAGMWPHPIGRVRRYEFTINLDSLRRYLAPLLWLSLKLSFLLYIFGRHASFNKRVILIGMAAGWVLWEAFAISQRHEAQTRRRERVQRQAAGLGAAGGGDPLQAVLERGRRRAERERIQQRLREHRQALQDAMARALPINHLAPIANTPNNPAEPVNGTDVLPAPPALERVAAPLPAPPQPAEAPVAPGNNNPPAAGAEIRQRRLGLQAAAADIRARGGAFPPGTEVRPFRPTSTFSPKYWFNSIAVVGLASEYRELGLHPIGERSMGSSTSEYSQWYKYLRNAKTCLILFIGTLLPEIEKKRKKALEKRSRILNLVVADAARERETREAQARRRVEETEDDGHRLVDRVEGPSDYRPNMIEAKREDETNKSGDVEIKSQVMTVTGVQNRQDVLVPRHHPQTRAPVIPELTLTGNEAGGSVIKGKAEDRGPIETMMSARREGKTPTPSPIVTRPEGSTSRTNIEEQVANDDPAALESPITPFHERPVVGGLDDTEDEDEELIAAGEDEAGMMLF